jgi:Ca-activated chloride channel family protein
MKARFFLLILFTLAALAAFTTPARADGIIIPDPPPCDPCPPPPCPLPGPCPEPSPMVQLAIRYHRVTVTIEDQVATTHVDQVFSNPNEWTVEGIYVFPIPQDAAVSDFTLWIDGEPVSGEVLDAEEARRTYEDIVYRMKDPALLEYADRGALRARIFPIPPQGERRIELEYSQVLPAENGLVRYVYPLNTEKFSAFPLEEVSVSVDVRSNQPIRAVYSPTHTVGLTRESENRVRAGYEGREVLPDTDFALYYSVGESEAFHLLSFRDPGDPADPDGFFLLLLAPRPERQEESISKDVILVLDRSGSMEGEKFVQAQEALRYILQHLEPEDRFNIVTFSTGVESYASSLRPASEANEALPWVDRLRAEGSTDINRALLEAADFGTGERPTYLIFLTDGLPTEGVVESQQILDNFASSAPRNLSLFAFGVGYDVDTFLLDSLAQAHHGSSSYVLPGEQLDEILSAFYAKISTPVLTGLSLDFGSLAAYDIYPEPLPDLFLGSQIVVTGRYRDGGSAQVTLSGTVNGEEQVFRYPEQVFERDSRGQDGPVASLPRLWATRKIGYLLNRIRLEGPEQETIDQIVRLSIRYGIVTPYTSYLVTEPLALGEAEQQRIAAEQYDQLQLEAAAPVTGQEAVEKAQAQGNLAGADAAAAPPSEAARSVRIIGARTFVFDGAAWMDTAFDPEKMETVKVAFLSDEYFSLVSSRPELADAFALGPAVIAISDGIAYEVVSEGESTGPVEIPPTFTPLPPPLDPRSTPEVLPTLPVEENPAPQPAPGMLPCTSSLLVPLLIGFLAMRRTRQKGLY